MSEQQTLQGSLAFSTHSIQTPLWLFFDHPKKQLLSGSRLRGVHEIQEVSDIMSIIEESGLQTQEGIIEYAWLLIPVGITHLKNLKRKKKTYYQISNSTLQFFRENNVKEMKLLACARTIENKPTIQQTTLTNTGVNTKRKRKTSQQHLLVPSGELTQEEENAIEDLDNGRCDSLFECPNQFKVNRVFLPLVLLLMGLFALSAVVGFIVIIILVSRA